MKPETFPAGDRNELLTFQIQLFSENAEGGVVGTWKDSFTEWAAVDRSSETNARFLIDYRQELTRLTPEDDPAQKKYRVVFDGAYWQIRNVLHDRNRRSTLIESDFSMMVEVTSLDSEQEREFIVGLPVVHP